ncbi:MAG: hypothetical protein ACLSF3_14730 [Anaerobutyricum hallii]|nr:hypothetical protein [Anaerobutyricum hallii]MEE1484602.1 hypothetical protein [Anaerobutyricum hallii]
MCGRLCMNEGSITGGYVN